VNIHSSGIDLICHSSSIDLAVYQLGFKSTMQMVVGSDLGALHFHNSDCLQVSIRGTSFYVFFITF